VEWVFFGDLMGDGGTPMGNKEIKNNRLNNGPTFGISALKNPRKF